MSMFFVEDIIEAVSSIAKRWPKMKDEVDILIKCLVNSLLNKDMIVQEVWQQKLPGLFLPLRAFEITCNVQAK